MVWQWGRIKPSQGSSPRSRAKFGGDAFAQLSLHCLDENPVLLLYGFSKAVDEGGPGPLQFIPEERIEVPLLAPLGDLLGEIKFDVAHQDPCQPLGGGSDFGIQGRAGLDGLRHLLGRHGGRCYCSG